MASKRKNYWLIRARAGLALAAAILLVLGQWGPAGLLASIAWLTGALDGSLGREISTKLYRVFPGIRVTDNAISWGLLIFGELAGLGIGLLRHGSTTWGLLALIGVGVAIVFQLVAELSLPQDSRFKAAVGGISGTIVTALVLIAAFGVS